jgi:hypothetical protein
VSRALGPRFASATLVVGLTVLVAVVGASTAAVADTAGASDREIAQAGVLRLADFPTGWQQSPRGSTTDEEMDAAAARIKACKPFLAFSKVNRRNPRAKSPSFGLAQSNVTDTVSVFPSTAKARAAMKTFANARYPACLDKLFRAVFEVQLRKDPKVAKQLVSVKVHMRRLAGVAIGDEAVAYAGTVDVGLEDGSVKTIGLGAVSVRVGDVLAGYAYSADTDISGALQPAIVSSVSRLRNATSSS